MHTRLAVVTVDIMRDSFGLMEFRSLSFASRLAKLVERIRELCLDLALKEPTAKWLIVWRENGLEGDDNHYVSTAEKRQFKEAMQALTAEHKQLAIVAGALRSGKQYPLLSKGVLSHTSRRLKRKFSQIERTYEAHEWIADVEVERNEEDMYSESMKHFMGVSAHPASMFYTLVRNTAYVFSNGQCVARHDKVAPYRELGARPMPNEIFQPATKKNHGPAIKLTFADGTVLPIGIEICREHLIGVLKRACMSGGKQTAPVIHFVLSNWISICHQNVVGDYFMHVDSERLYPVVARSVNRQVQLVQYRNDLLDSATTRLGQGYVPEAAAASVAACRAV